MNHICYMKKESGEYKGLLNGDISMIIRGVKLRKAPYECVFPGDRIYFADNKNRILLTALVANIENIEINSKSELKGFLAAYERRLFMNRRTYSKLSKSRFIVLLDLRDVSIIDSPIISKNIFMDTSSWMLVGNLKCRGQDCI